MMNKRLFTTILTGVITLSGIAQVSKTLSPYSQYGLGVLADQSQGFNRGMGGLSMGLRGGTMVNMLNPASYSAVDSLTMLIDMGVSGQITNFKEGGISTNRKSADFDYAVTLFRVMPKMGVSLGVVPFSNVGYSFSATEKVPNSILTSVMTYSGSGGFSQAFLGVGYEVFKGISVGANFSYLWGNYTKSLGVAALNDSHINLMVKAYETKINSYKLDFGAQGQFALDKDNVLTVGATFGVGHKLGADANMYIMNNDSQISHS